MKTKWERKSKAWSEFFCYKCKQKEIKKMKQRAKALKKYLEKCRKIDKEN